MNDAWFVGYTPQYITGTWVGFDEEASIGKGETGASAAAPIWLGFMSRILENEPVKVFRSRMILFLPKLMRKPVCCR
jgi:penicillin-binding protein 1A